MAKKLDISETESEATVGVDGSLKPNGPEDRTVGKIRLT